MFRRVEAREDAAAQPPAPAGARAGPRTHSARSVSSFALSASLSAWGAPPPAPAPGVVAEEEGASSLAAVGGDGRRRRKGVGRGAGLLLSRADCGAGDGSGGGRGAAGLRAARLLRIRRLPLLELLPLCEELLLLHSGAREGGGRVREGLSRSGGRWRWRRSTGRAGQRRKTLCSCLGAPALVFGGKAN